jgi:hypothetical protein
MWGGGFRLHVFRLAQRRDTVLINGLRRFGETRGTLRQNLPAVVNLIRESVPNTAAWRRLSRYQKKRLFAVWREW